jgi:hyperosmotically inducible protein
MKKIMLLVLSSVLLLGTVACDNAKTSSNAPESTEQTGEVPTDQTVQANKRDATSQVRRDQLNADIRAREERNNVTRGGADRANSDLARS